MIIIGVKFEKPPAPKPRMNLPIISIGRLITSYNALPTMQKTLKIKTALILRLFITKLARADPINAPTKRVVLTTVFIGSLFLSIPQQSSQFYE